MENNTTASVYVLRLFITGASPNSVRAVTNIKRICEQYLKNRYTLEIIDIYQKPDISITEQLVAVPVLVKEHPLPVQRLIGNMSDTRRVLKGLDIHEPELDNEQ